jgi:tetratricopeptide (TPR) repeat protein
MLQRRYAEALAAYQEARGIFERLGEPGGVATIWHQIGMVYKRAGEPEAAERAYRQSLAIEVQQGNRSGQASSLTELGNLYYKLGQLEEAVTFYRQAADLHMALGDQRAEGLARNNSADTLAKLRRYDEARAEVRRAIECKRPFGHAGTIWNAWNILHDIERGCGGGAGGVAAGARPLPGLPARWGLRTVENW